MSKIRDLGINAIPEKRSRDGNDGFFAACPGQSRCPGQSGCPEDTKDDQTCEECTDTGPPGPCQDVTCQLTFKDDDQGEDKKHKALSHEAIAELQSRLQRKIAEQVS